MGGPSIQIHGAAALINYQAPALAYNFHMITFTIMFMMNESRNIANFLASAPTEPSVQDERNKWPRGWRHARSRSSAARFMR